MGAPAVALMEWYSGHSLVAHLVQWSFIGSILWSEPAQLLLIWAVLVNGDLSLHMLCGSCWPDGHLAHCQNA